jgi:hypothetical protein
MHAMNNKNNHVNCCELKNIGHRMSVIVFALMVVASARAQTIEKIDPPESGFYGKKIDLGGIPIKAHDIVSDDAMREAAKRISRMLAKLPQAWSNLAILGAEEHIIGKDQMMVDLPDYAEWKGKKFEGSLTLDQRARGLGGLVSSCGEDNLLKLANDHYRDHRDICSHEFAHTLMDYALGKEIRDRIHEQWRKSTEKGLWKTMYAATNDSEFFAELSMWYFDSRGDYGNLKPPPRVGRDWLAEYDPEAFKLIDEIYSGKFLVPPLNFEKLSLLPPSEEKKLRSRASEEATQISMKNLRKTKVEICWLDFSGKRIKYGEVAPGGAWSMSTFETHPWIFLDETGAPIGEIVAGKKPGRIELR